MQRRKPKTNPSFSRTGPHNSSALAAYHGIDTTDGDVADLFFDEVLCLRSSIAKDVENCKALDSEARDDLAFDLRTTDPDGPNPAEPFVEIINRFHELVAKSNPKAVSENRSEIENIDRELRYLIDCAKASVLD